MHNQLYSLGSMDPIATIVERLCAWKDVSREKIETKDSFFVRGQVFAYVGRKGVVVKLADWGGEHADILIHRRMLYRFFCKAVFRLGLPSRLRSPIFVSAPAGLPRGTTVLSQTSKTMPLSGPHRVRKGHCNEMAGCAGL